jgi:hypothetical protein
MATWSCGRHAGPDKPPTPVFINHDNVLTVDRQGDPTTVLMVGGEKVYIDTMPETLIGAALPSQASPLLSACPTNRKLSKEGLDLGWQAVQ